MDMVGRSSTFGRSAAGASGEWCPAWVFANEVGNRDTHILDTLKKICRRAGIAPKTVHALHHSFGARFEWPAYHSLISPIDLVTKIWPQLIAAPHDRDTFGIRRNDSDRKLLPN